ncbi:carbohydrate ABC transporter permease [Verminephrobacter aporrectodeae]|uniref:carbohydrate ABC transporter permease n=1 Tax=Verminephrobacter aporrectodeae TaxID=1110389 RepID=UPI0002377722|nr:sugar ABC transporter permease [Verminephrobacter aporrectodeae]
MTPMTPAARMARLTPYAYILPALLVMLAGLVYPIANAVQLSFYDWPMGTDFDTARFVGIEAFVQMLESPQVWTSMGVTLAFVFIAVTAELLLGVALALFLEKPVRGMRFFRSLFVLPMMIAPICVGLIWRYLFDASFGPINQALAWIGIAPQAWLASPALAFGAMVLTDIWQWTPFVLIMVLAGLQGLDESVMEAARMDGANGWQQIVRVKLPIVQPILIVTLLARMIDGFRGLEVIYVMTFGGPGLSTELFSLHIFKAAFISQKLGYSAALSILLLVIVSALSLAILLISNPLKAASRR